MTENDDEKIYPLANWDLGPIEEHELVVFRPHFISTPGQSAESAQISRYYAMTVQQAKELKMALESAIQVLDAKNN
jgi:biofilm regulator BssS